MRGVQPIRRSRHLASILLAGLGLVALLVARPVLAQRSAIDLLPLTPGNSWTYDGTIWWLPLNSLRVLEERVKLEVEVLEVVERPGARAALLRGYPRDLVTSVPNRFEGKFTLLQVGSRVYLLRGERGREAMRRVQDPVDSLADLMLNSELVLDFPLEPGKTFCSPGVDGPGEGRPCWFVRGEALVERLPVVEGGRVRGRERYILDLRSGADHEVRGFVPGVGFTSFAIGHFGDPSALELELIEVDLTAPVIFLKTLDLADARTLEVATGSRSPEPANRDPSAGDRPPSKARATPVVAREEVVTAALDDGGGAAGSSASSPGSQSDVAPEPTPAPPPAEIPVPDDQEPPCADEREWFVVGNPIEFEGRRFDPIGKPEPINLDNIVSVGEYDGVPVYVGRHGGQPHMNVWLPVCSTTGTYRLYADSSPRN